MNTMKINNIIGIGLWSLGSRFMRDKMDYKEYDIYDKDYVSSNFTYVGNLDDRYL